MNAHAAYKRFGVIANQVRQEHPEATGRVIQDMSNVTRFYCEANITNIHFIHATDIADVARDWVKQ